ncbi:MAG: MFS transporter [Clostridia bacterium]|nr:MFS transporter [Clostridia bacterium]
MQKYKRTMLASMLGIFTQAVSNITALLFVPFMDMYGLSFVHLGILVGVNFGVQMMVDLIFAPLIDKLGYRRLVLPACIMAFVGFVIFGTAAFAQDHFLVLMLANIIIAAACGLMEILLSPMVTAMDSDHGKYVSLLHTAFAWGQIITIILTTVLLMLVKNENWFVIPFFWSILPAVCFFTFLSAPFPQAIAEEKRERASGIIRNPIYLLLLVAMFFGAASEITMCQFASTFAEKALGFDKVTGDLIGMCGFAVFFGIGRTLQTAFSGKINLNKTIIASALCASVCYVVAAVCPIPAVCIAACAVSGLCTALLWPGSAIVAVDCFPLAGSWLYASLAIFGDSGAALVPLATGSIADAAESGIAAAFSDLIGVDPSQGGLRIALLCAALCPLVCGFAHLILYKKQKHQASK